MLALAMPSQRMPVPHGTPFGMPFAIDAPGGPIVCRRDGNPAGPTLVFSNSHATHLGMWDAQVAALGERYHLVRYDQRGHGATPPRQGDCTFDMLARDIESILDALRLSAVTLVGVSMGAVTVMRCAALLGHRIQRVVACDGQWASPPGAYKMWQRRIDAALAHGPAALADETLARWFRPASLAARAACVATARAMIEATSGNGYAQCASAMQQYDFRADYPALALPVLYVAGECDGRLPGVMREMAQATASSRMVEIPDCAHLPNLERPQAFNNVIQHFLDDTECERFSESTS